MLDKLEAIKDRYIYLEEQLADPEIIADMKRYTKLSKEYKDLKPIVDAYEAYALVMGNIETSREMLKESDPDMREMAQMELDELLPKKAEMEEEIKVLLIPKDPEDSKDVIFEIRSGTGGDEASLFAGDLYRMYTRFFDAKGYRVETVSINEGTVGGYNKIVLEVSGEDVYGTLKFESGAHRVQRIPQTESQGRVHTSAATAVVMPKLEMEDVDINKADLKIDTYRSSGAGGQHVNKTESAVRITHLPTGIVSESQDGRSQIKNREIALQRLYVKIMEVQREQFESEQAAKRKSLVGSGDRAGKIRTYNYPQNRVTDHRLEGEHKNFNLQQVIEGDIEPIIEQLKLAENAEKMKAGAME
ncbi:peptide chain release factor 1 [Phaeodactylibacter luteus]|uniref:Peptide chain release factor 1 n=1 Tax=Phaeodactylibacter luteus TaxID=1564516 RepID=A0A5C6RM77_9BACT|nr:peptide chain release factor 1 [Phaeodactylibacter luteus]TXB63009.1 peptide chain release factor 1 [Phaeodactylibacter luteus]